jgi:hypothetical protein
MLMFFLLAFPSLCSAGQRKTKTSAGLTILKGEL